MQLWLFQFHCPSLRKIHKLLWELLRFSVLLFAEVCCCTQRETGRSLPPDECSVEVNTKDELNSSCDINYKHLIHFSVKYWQHF